MISEYRKDLAEAELVYSVLFFFIVTKIVAQYVIIYEEITTFLSIFFLLFRFLYLNIT